jgi:large subunit ribosomal protein L25
MSTSRPSLAAEHREVTGKKVAHLRRDGRLPAVVFGHGVASNNISIDTHEFELLRRRAGANTLIDLSIDGGKADPVLVHGVQTSVVTRRPLHVDLFVVRMTEELIVEVPLVSEGESDAVENGGGTLMHVMGFFFSRGVSILPRHANSPSRRSIPYGTPMQLASRKVSRFAQPTQYAKHLPIKRIQNARDSLAFSVT